MRHLCIFLILIYFNSIYSQTLNKVISKDEKIEIISQQNKYVILPLSDNAIRIKCLPGNEVKELPEVVFIGKYKAPDFKVKDSKNYVHVMLKRFNLIYDKSRGIFSFVDKNGKVFLLEKENSRIIRPNSISGENCYIIEQSFITSPSEYIFGFGQFQDGHYNIRDVSRRLIQVNSQISLPFIYSSKGYCLIWHQYGLTDYNPADNFVNLNKVEKISGINQIAEVTTTTGTQKVLQNQSIYRGRFEVPEDGEYIIFLDLGDMGNRHFVAIDGNVVIDQTNFWLPPCVSTKVKLKAGNHEAQIICKDNNTPKLSWRKVENYITFRSPHAKLLDYIVIFGPEADSVIATYHRLTKNTPMLPIWAYGFWQCRERYTSSQQLIETVKEFRNRKLPMDVIVQDWQYWGNNGWGVPQFDEKNYPDPSEFIKKLHDLNSYFCISIWSNPDINSPLGRKFFEKNLYIPNTNWLDYFNPDTRKEYWIVLKENMFDHGVDAWWMDAVEPENDALKGTNTYLGKGEFYRLIYPLMVSKAVYEGQREVTNEKRVCILTRSAYLGQHRYGTINWSGDINSDWDAFKRQIVAGLNYTITGMPYWTTDIGGFFRPGISQYSDTNYHEILIRWFQWGAFNPIFRVHGYQSETEPWKYGSNVEENIRKILNLRYRLLPYIYSMAWQITKKGYMMMRPLVMDFSLDKESLEKPYEFMFGKSILVAPVTEPGIKEQEIYLPKGVDWYDFWTGEKFSGGQIINKKLSIDIIPLFVKAGTILPIGPELQFTAEKKWDTLEIRIYEGADGEFTLYEDEGNNYNYEKGIYSTITFKWYDKRKMLIISDKKGNYPGMLQNRTFILIKVSKNVGTGYYWSNNNLIINYNGLMKKIKLQ